MGAVKKKLSKANRRLRERSRLSFLFVVFFFGLFGIIIVMETFMPDPNKRGNIDDDEDSISEVSGDYLNFDVSYEEQIVNIPRIISKGKSNSGKSSIDKKSGHPNNKSLPKIKRIPIQPDWQKVIGSQEKFLVYSAYYIQNLTHIRVIGATKTKTTQRVQCRLYDNDTKHFGTVDGNIRTIRENWNLKYSACFVICPLPNGVMSPVPRYVSVMAKTSPTASASNILRIQFPEEKTDLMVEFSVCVKPIHFDYDHILPFIEWMEFHRIMGVEHFTFYNHTIGPGVSCLMEELYGNIVTILPWTLPFISQKEIRTEGLFAALNDCVYRHRGASKYLLLVDLDEMIVPRRASNYSTLIEQLNNIKDNNNGVKHDGRKRVGAYSIQNAFFYLQWPDEELNFNFSDYPLAHQISNQLLMMKKTRRRARLHPHKQRSKYICNPDKVMEAGNHFIWEMVLGYSTQSAPSHLAALHHYRVCEFGGDKCVNSPSVVDKSAHNFSHSLIYGVANKLKEYSEKCHADLSKLILVR